MLVAWRKPEALAPDAAHHVHDIARPLGGLNGQRPPAPDWYRAAMAMPVEEHSIDVEGAGIEILCWGDIGRPGILLMHGSSAHARWWGPIAPLLAQEYRVASLSWSGMGGSDWRDRYSVAGMAREAWAAAQAGRLFEHPRRPTFFAHSFGSKAAALLAASHGAELAGVGFLDSLLIPGETMPYVPDYRPRLYASETEALDRFRFAPEQPGTNLYIIDDIARAAVHQAPGGWTWRFDPSFYQKLEFESGWKDVGEAQCKLAFMRGALSQVLTPAQVEAQRGHARPGTIFLDIPESYHHLMIDQPLAVVSALRALVAGWAG